MRPSAWFLHFRPHLTVQLYGRAPCRRREATMLVVLFVLTLNQNALRENIKLR